MSPELPWEVQLILKTRSWIASADKAKSVQQVQLRLIMDRVSLPVSNMPTLYPAVIETWKKAMLALENLINGQPQRIQSGAVLLGISAWHIYPDMTVLLDKTYTVVQDDGLVGSGGVVTVGLENRPDQSGDGIFWSLPLAHLRYYGTPSVTKRYSGLLESQVSFDDFRYVILGIVLSGWGPQESDWSSAFRLITRLNTAAVECDQRKISKNRISQTGLNASGTAATSLPWLESLARSCSAVDRSSDTERRKQASLIGLGQRKCKNFLSPQIEQPCPGFGLTDFELLLSTVGDLEPDGKKTELVDAAKIKFIRTWAYMSLDRETYVDAIIRYRPQTGYGSFRYTNVFDKTVDGTKKRRKLRHEDSGFKHWKDDVIAPIVRGVGPQDVRQWRKEYRVGLGAPKEGEGSLDWDDNHYEDAANRWLPTGEGQDKIECEFVCGDPGSVAIFQPIGAAGGSRQHPNHMSTACLLHCLEQGYLDTSRVATVLLSAKHLDKFATYFGSLLSLYGVEQLYHQLPGASIDLQVTKRPIHEYSWSPALRDTVPSASKLHRSRLSAHPPLDQALSCIATFETGSLNLDTEKMQGVIALSYRDSLYVASYLVEDPTEAHVAFPVRRVTGNVGKPGFSLVTTPPANPAVKQVELDEWHLVEHKPCDGRPVDHFASTSLHLCLTGYELPLDVGPRGSRDAEVAYIEAAISVHEKGKWVADLDVVTFRKACEKAEESNCQHGDEQGASFPTHEGLVTIENWTELLDPPTGNCVFLANKNPLARFAAAAFCVQQGHGCRVVGKADCWPCAKPLGSTQGTTIEIKRKTSCASEDSNSDAKSQDEASDQEMSDDGLTLHHNDLELFPGAHSLFHTREEDSGSNEKCLTVFVW